MQGVVQQFSSRLPPSTPAPPHRPSGCRRNWLDAEIFSNSPRTARARHASDRKAVAEPLRATPRRARRPSVPCRATCPCGPAGQHFIRHQQEPFVAILAELGKKRRAHDEPAQPWIGSSTKRPRRRSSLSAYNRRRSDVAVLSIVPSAWSKADVRIGTRQHVSPRIRTRRRPASESAPTRRPRSLAVEVVEATEHLVCRWPHAAPHPRLDGGGAAS